MLNFANKADIKLFMYEKENNRIGIKEALDQNPNGKSFSVITGPEGGFAEYEADIAKNLGFYICSMGNRIFRCETAPIVALSAIMYSTGNL